MVAFYSTGDIERARRLADALLCRMRGVARAS